MTAIQRVLVVEDLPEVSLWLVDKVRSIFAIKEIRQVYNLEQAEAELKQTSFDLVLMDLGLPDGDGTRLIPLCKQLNPNKHCIVTTIFDDAEHLFEALRAGADGYLLKDTSEREFKEQLQGILDGRPPLSTSIAQKLLKRFQPETKPEDKSQLIEELTPRERELLELIARGLSVRDAAEVLTISYHTAASYLKVIYQKLQVHNRVEATVKAINLGLVQSNR